MICEQCHAAMSGCLCHACGWGMPLQEFRGGQTLRLHRCDVPGCGRIVRAGDPETNLTQGLHLPGRCRFHRDPTYTAPPRPASMPRLSDPGPSVSFEEIREEFARIRAASGRALRAYWAEQGITMRPVSSPVSGWSSLSTGLRTWAEKWFPPIP